MRRVFLDNLPKWENNRLHGKTKWLDCIGLKVKFIYDEIEGNVEILDFNKNKHMVKLRYSDNIKYIHTGNFIKCEIGVLFGKRKREHKYKVGDIIEDLKFGKIKILENIRLNSGKYGTKGYLYECLDCGNEDYIRETSLNRKSGCNVCSGSKVLKGINDLWTTHPEIAKLLKDSEKGYELSAFSHKETEFICNNCKLERFKVVANVTTKGFACPKCSDGISYPEKFIFNVLEQLSVNFNFQKVFNWSENKRYDFYVNELECIIEVHGLQHYIESFVGIGGKKLEEEQENDREKEMLATNNGIKHYIVMDCRKSELEYIKDNILESEISKMYNLNKINWNKCHEYACNSLVKTACEFWNNGKNTYEISNILQMTPTTIIKYLKQGNKIGMCKYDPKDSYDKTMKNNHIKRKIKVIQLSNDNKLIQEWNSIREASIGCNLDETSICRTCKGENKSSGGYKWMYKEDYVKYIESNNKK